MEHKIKRIVLQPIGGLRNRLRATASAIDLSQELGAKLTVIWNANAECNAQWGDLFQPVEQIDQLRQHSKLLLRLKSRICPLLRCQKPLPLTKIDDLEEWIATHGKSCRLYIQSFSKFYRPHSESIKLFIPLPHLQQQINFLTQQEQIGIHIRRTDNKKSISESPLSLFETMIQEEINRNHEARFFLATDDLETERQLQNRFPNRITVQPNKLLDRNNRVAIQNAVVDLFALSRCKKVWGSYWSSFSVEAARIGGIPLTILKQEQKRGDAE